MGGRLVQEFRDNRCNCNMVTWLQKLLILDRLTCLAVLKGQPSRGSSLPFNSAELWKITWQSRSHRASALLWHPPLNLTFRFKSAPLLRFSSIQCCDLERLKECLMSVVVFFLKVWQHQDTECKNQMPVLSPLLKSDREALVAPLGFPWVQLYFRRGILLLQTAAPELYIHFALKQ